MKKSLKIQSQTDNPDDDPEDGTVVSICLYEGDRCERVWVLTEVGDPRINKVEIDALGKKRVIRENLSTFDLTPPTDTDESLQLVLDLFLEMGDFIEIDPMYYATIS
tara:strand:+ start:238 stop:558 length:321 start_codon:yes stop_codon:yes gene_type:complete